ncbi:type II toxin-antitoxin system prevent-host-death family antitoxin [Entomomonas sp. E2T0]|uniref:type II toxin-antitoxin system Phd/YefM family antitoxin n=1 Tax=Entomomonas sp. E2T0 TaxID=2930213 RepID=UPI00222832F9|nr:type II toxin-antitoxin system prevent-host-death family antitoxin [Entomomonas sp. E2T0]UYZ84697.1 type II toxin-antitoxin system prevent-host-death family antitoxin [Entomomonas sp. E2T0]
MEKMSYPTFQTNMEEILDRVNDTHQPVLVNRSNGKPVVIMGLNDFRGYEETLYLMSSPENAKKLNEAINEIERGNVTEHNLIE